MGKNPLHKRKETTSSNIKKKGDGSFKHKTPHSKERMNSTMYKIVFNNNRTTTFNSLEEMENFLNITREEVNQLLSGENPQLKRKLGIKNIINKLDELVKNIQGMKEKINKNINVMRESLNTLPQTISNVLNYTNRNKLVIGIKYKLESFNEEYKRLKQEGKVKGIGISLPLGSGNRLDGDSYKLDYVLRVLRKYDGFEELGETPLLLFTPHYSTYMKTNYKGNIDDIYWIGIDNEMIVSPYGFNIHNHLNPTTYNHKREINMNVELIKKIRSEEGMELGELHTHIDRYSLGTMFIFLSLLIDELTEEEFKDLVISDSSHIITNTSLRESKLSSVEKFNIKNFEERVKELQEIRETKKYSLDELGVFPWYDGEKIKTILDKKFKRKKRTIIENSNKYSYQKEENCVGEHFYTKEGHVIQYLDIVECV